MSHIQRVHLIVQGRVQGVFYRDTARRRAAELGLSGKVRNLMDGTVEIIAEGPRDSLDELILWAHEGPPAASVTAVDISFSEATGEFRDFRVAF